MQWVAKMHISKKIIENGADYLLMVKENQPTLHDEIQNFFEQAENIKFEGVSHNSFITEEKGHGRNECRELYVSDDIDWLPMKDDWTGLKCVVMLKSFRTFNGMTSEENLTDFYHIFSIEWLNEVQEIIFSTQTIKNPNLIKRF